MNKNRRGRNLLRSLYVAWALCFVLIVITYCVAFYTGHNLIMSDKVLHHINASASQEAACPLNCGKRARRYLDLDKAAFFWRCSFCSPGLTFRDREGKPVLEMIDKGGVNDETFFGRR